MGHKVRGLEADPERLEALRAGRIAFYEPGLAELVASGVSAGRLSFWSSSETANVAARADMVVIAVGTHGGMNWQTDTVISALADIVPVLQDGTPIVVRSTLPPDFLPMLRATVIALRERAGKGDVPVMLNPEFTREGRAIDDFLHPDRVVLGAIHDPAGIGERLLRQMYDQLAAPTIAMDGVDACLTKLGSNLFLATKISFANELARLCEAQGADVTAVVSAMGYDRRIGREFLGAGLGFGGSCLPHQVSMTVEAARRAGSSTPLLAAVEEINLGQRLRFARHLMASTEAEAPRVALLGLAFKPNTDDLRDAPSLDIARHLLEMGARPVAFDPMPSARERAAALVPGLEVVDDLDTVLRESDAIGLVTEWDVFRRLDWSEVREQSRAASVIDGRNALDPAAITAAGFGYQGIGRRYEAPVAPATWSDEHVAVARLAEVPNVAA
jgi:UDPglucose 6-dehydrogenase